MLLVGQQEGHLACKKLEWWGTGVVICLEQGADLYMAQLMPLPLTVSCSSKIQIGFTFLVTADLGTSGKRAVKRVCVVYLIYNSQCLKSLPQKFKYGFTAGNEHWRVHSVTPADENRLCPMSMCAF